MNRTQVASLIIPVISIACLIGGGSCFRLTDKIKSMLLDLLKAQH